MINISYFYDLLESMGNRRQLSTGGFTFHAHAGMHCFTAQCQFWLVWLSHWPSGLIYVSEQFYHKFISNSPITYVLQIHT